MKIIGLWAKMLYDTLTMGGSLAQKKKKKLPITKAIELMSDVSYPTQDSSIHIHVGLGTIYLGEYAKYFFIKVGYRPTVYFVLKENLKKMIKKGKPK